MPNLFLTNEESDLLDRAVSSSLVQLNTLVNIDPVCKSLGLDPKDDGGVDEAGDRLERIQTKLRAARYQAGFTVAS